MVLHTTIEKHIKPDCVWKLAPRCPFGIDYLFLGRTNADCLLLYLCNETLFRSCVFAREKQIRIIIVNGSSLCSVPRRSVPGEPTCCSRSRVVCWDNQPRLLCVLFIPRSRALSHSYYTTGPADASAPRTKRQAWNLLCIWACCCKQRKE